MIKKFEEYKINENDDMNYVLGNQEEVDNILQSVDKLIEDISFLTKDDEDNNVIIDEVIQKLNQSRSKTNISNTVTLEALKSDHLRFSVKSKLKQDIIDFTSFATQWCFDNSSFEFHELDNDSQLTILDEFLNPKPNIAKGNYRQSSEPGKEVNKSWLRRNSKRGDINF